ncbi:hypothetical protein V6N13_126837 [Hibiscus sabdariffa]
MTRANPQGPIFDFDPEIERTQRNLKRRVRRLMEVNRNNGQQPADGQNLPAQADVAIAPPIPQNNQQPPVRTVCDYLAEDLEGLNPAITKPEFEAEHFELKSVMFNMLNTLGQFSGSPTENARQHLKSFLEICNSFKIHGVSNDVLKLKLFPYSLRDKAKAWLNNLQPSSLQSWTQLCRSFLAKFSYTNMTDHLRNQITSFRQEDDEAMHEAWERYRDFYRRCPMHGLPEWTQVSIFYNSVNTPTRMMLNASANGTLPDKLPREILEILDKLAQNDYQHPISRRGTTRRGPAQLDSSDTILAQIASLTNMVKNMQKQPHIQEVKALDAFCELCGNNHDASECGQNIESSCYVGNYNKNTMSNTYNPTWRKHPNFSWKNQNNTLNPQPPTQTGFQNQPRQNPQQLLPRPIGGFPSDTEVAKGATHEQYKAITIRSGKILIHTSNQRGTAASPSAAINTPAEADEPAKTSEDHDDPHNTNKGESSAEPSHSKPDKSEDIRPPPPFPQRLKKQKKKQIEEFETAAATETCLALMQNKPEGKIEDILVQVDKFIFPADFLILDCKADDDAPIILGRPFLATGRVLFDFGNEELILRVDDQQVKFAIQRTNKCEAEADDCWMIQATQEFKSEQPICPGREETHNTGNLDIEAQTKPETGNWVQLRLGRKIDRNTSAAQRGIRLDHCRYQGNQPNNLHAQNTARRNHKQTVDAQRRLNQAMKDVDDKGDISNRDNGSCLGRNLGRNSDLGRASCCVIGLCISPNNCLACSYTISLDGLLSAETCTPSNPLPAWALGLDFECSRPPFDALIILGCSGDYSDENAIPFRILPLCPGLGFSAGNLPWHILGPL